MNLLIVALPIEAKPWISQLGLKEDPSFFPYSVFSGKELTLVVSGSGKIRSAMATTFALSRCSSLPEIVWNFGIAADSSKNRKLGSVYLQNKISDWETGKSVYPDMLVNYRIPESSLVTVGKPNENPADGSLVDMEGFGFFLAASKFLPKNRIHSLKIVSDFLESQLLDTKSITTIIEAQIETLQSIVTFIPPTSRSVLDADASAWLDRQIESLRLTETQKKEAQNMFRGFILRGGDWKEISEKFQVSPFDQKEEAKKYYAKLKRLLSA